MSTETFCYTIMKSGGISMGLYGVLCQAIWDLLCIVMGVIAKCLEYISHIPLALAMVIRRLFPIRETAGQETPEVLSDAPVPPDVSHEMPASHNAPPPYQVCLHFQNALFITDFVAGYS